MSQQSALELMSKQWRMCTECMPQELCVYLYSWESSQFASRQCSNPTGKVKVKGLLELENTHIHIDLIIFWIIDKSLYRTKIAGSNTDWSYFVCSRCMSGKRCLSGDLDH